MCCCDLNTWAKGKSWCRTAVIRSDTVVTNRRRLNAGETCQRGVVGEKKPRQKGAAILDLQEGLTITL